MLFAAAVVVVVVVAVACLRGPQIGSGVGEALRAVRTGVATARQRRLLAQEAARRGFDDVAEDFWTQSDMQAALEQWEQTHRSPLKDVSNQAWQRWVETNEQDAAVARQHPERSPLYGLRDRELDDAGVDRPTTSSEEYAALVTVAKNLQHGIEARYAGVIGTEIEGTTATLSGLLAVARCAGLGGLATWVSDAAERSRFGRTTQAYKRATGLF